MDWIATDWFGAGIRAVPGGYAQFWSDRREFAPNAGGYPDIHNPRSLVAQCSARILADGMFSALLPSVHRNLSSLTAS
jgi:hypothetical protein